MGEMVSARTLEVRPVPVRIIEIAAISCRLLIGEGEGWGRGWWGTCAPAWYFQALSLLKSVRSSS